MGSAPSALFCPPKKSGIIFMGYNIHGKSLYAMRIPLLSFGFGKKDLSE
jgi:hypothetical protein